MKKIRALWASFVGDTDRRVRLGRLLGLTLIVIGFAAIAKAWDGAASKFSLPEMFPYLLSGGFMGVALVITGALLLFLSTLRQERQLLSDRYEEMATLLSRNLARMAVSVNGSESSGEHVIAGATAYHRPGCRVLEGKDDLMPIPLEQAAAEKLAACRVCDPPTLPSQESTEKPEAEKDDSGPDAEKESVAEPIGAGGTPTP